MIPHTMLSPTAKRYHGFIGLAVLIPAEVLMLMGVRPFTTWFYSLAWWPYIFIVDQAVYQLQGRSLWVNRRREFFFLIPLSVFFWMIFEGVNVYLQNWRYVSITPETWLRWPGYFIAYSTVLPGIFETTELLLALGLFKDHRVKPIRPSTSWYKPFMIIGLFFLFLPMFWPQYFFPLIWGAFIFLLEPLVHGHGGKSLMQDWEQGDLRMFFLLLTAGLICGMLWEFWNFWAEAKWVYHVPYVGWLKIFEMPILGFGGFPPFAVELYVMTNFVGLFRRGRTWLTSEDNPAIRTGKPWQLIGTVMFLVVFVLVARSIDQYTIWSYED